MDRGRTVRMGQGSHAETSVPKTDDLAREALLEGAGDLVSRL